MTLAEAVRQLETRMMLRADLGNHGHHITWSVADLHATRIVLRELRDLQAQTAELAEAVRQLEAQILR